MPSTAPPVKERFHALDLLRGFFIVIIICDHLGRWPSLFSIFSGKALLWVTAAEGFIIISGLLVGYIRGYKSKAASLKDTSFKLWRRALTLYLWAILGTLIYTSIIWYLPLTGGHPGMPLDKGDWTTLLIDSITLNYTFVWVYFLKLYALYLAFSPVAIWLFRKGLAWVVAGISLLVLILGWYTHNEVLQWQFLFFIPATVGYVMPTIQSWWKKQSAAKRHALASGIIGATIVTIVLSIIGTYYPQLSHILDTATISLYAKESISLMRAFTAFLWFTGYLLVFLYLEKYIQRWLGWLLMPIGTHSLTAYILHGAVIVCISFFFVTTESIFANTLLDIAAILMVWALIKIPGINRIIPR